LVKDAKLGLVLLLSTWILVFFTSSPTSDAKGKMYESKNNKIYGTTKNYTRQQKIQQGLIIQDKMTLCRLKKRVKTKSGEEVCITKVATKHLKWQLKRAAQGHISASIIHMEKNLALTV